jgi:hypothetical protein
MKRASLINVKVFHCLKLTERYAMKAYGEMNVQIHVFLTSALVGSGQFHAPASLSPGKQLLVPI